jgi:hypothetical protein
MKEYKNFSLNLPLLLNTSHYSYFVQPKPLSRSASLTLPLLERRRSLNFYFSTLASSHTRHVTKKRISVPNSGWFTGYSAGFSVWQEKNSFSPLYLRGKKEIESANAVKKSKIIKGILGQGHNNALNSSALLHHNTKSIVYSFNKVNNLYPLLTKTEYILKSVFRSMFSLISKPIYLIQQDKIIIRIFVFLSPKIDKYLDTSTILSSITSGINPAKNSRTLPTTYLRGPIGEEKNQKLKVKRVSDKIQVVSPNSGVGKSIVYPMLKNINTIAGFSVKSPRFKLLNFLRFKNSRPNAIEILKTQILKDNSSYFTAINYLTKSWFIWSPVGNSVWRELDINKVTQSASFPLSSPNSLKKGRKSPISLNIKERDFNLLTNYPYISLVSNFKTKLEKLSLVFEKLFNKKVEFEIIKAQLPFQDSNILAQILGYNANNYKFRRMLKILIPRAVIKNPSTSSFANLGEVKKELYAHVNKKTDCNLDSKRFIKSDKFIDLVSFPCGPNTLTGGSTRNNLISIALNKNLIKNFIGKREELKQINHGLRPYTPCSYLSGMNIKLAGRLMTQSIRPRFTVQGYQEGSLARVKIHLIEKSRFTGKNKRGVFSFTITISHTFN